MERCTLFLDVLLPLNVPGYFTYRVPFESNSLVKIGQRVVVPFGNKKLYSALVRRIHETPPQGYASKYILSVLDEEPIVTELQFLFWEWIARYYMCHPGNVMAMALPAALRLASESAVVINPDFDGDFTNLSKNEMLIVEALSKQPQLSISEVMQITGLQKIFSLLKTMIEKSIIMMEEELQQRYRPKMQSYISFHPNYEQEENLKQLFEELEKKKSTHQQLNTLLLFMKLLSQGKKNIKKSELLNSDDISLSAFNTLVKKEVFQIIQKEESRLEEFEALESPENIHLNDEQQSVFDSIMEQWTEKPVTLLHGVTSSGKTEIFIKLIAETIKQGKQVLYLLPEIALTVQLINRLRKYFGNEVGIYHSRYSTNERVETWQKTIDKENPYKIILGARSAIFLPFSNLGLVIVDEEHDTSYKQTDSQPRYQGRDTALYLAGISGAKTILGSATPSVESYFNAKAGKYQLTELSKRYGGLLMPEIFVSDLKEAHKKKEMKSHFSNFLLEQIQEALKAKEQVILFQNRRGFSLRLECEACHWIPECKNCDVSMVYHKNMNMLRCHYCGYSVPIPNTCPVCNSKEIKMKGFGTEKVEDELAIFFPEANIARMDLDTTRSKRSYMQIISDFEERKIDILVGTQMVTKGLDFDNVSIVGILSADGMLSFPDFRSYERSFQQMAQVSGRAGRKNKRGKVIIQTFNPYNQAIRDVVDNDYLSMYNCQILERKVFYYPPHNKLIKITTKHKESDYINHSAEALAKSLRGIFGKSVLGPEYPLVARIRNLYIKEIIIKIEKTISPSSAKEKISELIENFLSDKNYKQTIIAIDVDPQ